MEENNNEEATNKKEYKITLRGMISIIIVVILLTIVVVVSCYSIYQKNNNKMKLDEYVKSIGMKNDSDAEPKDDYYENDEEYNDENDGEYNDEEEYKYSCEYAIEFIYNLNSNPFYTFADFMPGHDILKNVEKQADGSYNINKNFEDLVDDLYYCGLYPTTLKTMDILKNNINVISDKVINVKDTGVEKCYNASMLSFENIAPNEYKGYVCLAEYNQDNFEENKFAEVTAQFNSEGLITNLSYNEVKENDVPENLKLEDYDNYSYYDEFSYSDFIKE